MYDALDTAPGGDVFVPVDDEALYLLEEALDYRFVGEDENGDPVGSGEFSLYQLLEFWSGYDPAMLESVGSDVSEYHGPILGTSDVIRALITEVRRLRALR